MDRKAYNSCVASGLKGKKLSKDERKLEFCIVAKECSKKAGSREEAEQMCLESFSHPKEPKVRGSKKKSGQSCEKGVLQIASCMVEVIDMDMASNINSVGAAIANAMIECTCQSKE